MSSTCLQLRGSIKRHELCLSAVCQAQTGEPSNTGGSVASTSTAAITPPPPPQSQHLSFTQISSISLLLAAFTLHLSGCWSRPCDPERYLSPVMLLLFGFKIITDVVTDVAFVILTSYQVAVFAQTSEEIIYQLMYEWRCIPHVVVGQAVCTGHSCHCDMTAKLCTQAKYRIVF